MTFTELLFKKPFVPPPVVNVRVHLQDGYAEPEEYRPNPVLQKRLAQRASKVTETENKILEYVRLNPACTRDQIASSLKMSTNRMADRLASMLTRGSIVREGRCMSRRGGPKTYFYWVAKRGGVQ